MARQLLTRTGVVHASISGDQAYPLLDLKRPLLYLRPRLSLASWRELLTSLQVSVHQLDAEQDVRAWQVFKLVHWLAHRPGALTMAYEIGLEYRARDLVGLEAQFTQVKTLRDVYLMVRGNNDRVGSLTDRIERISDTHLEVLLLNVCQLPQAVLQFVFIQGLVALRQVARELSGAEVPLAWVGVNGPQTPQLEQLASLLGCKIMYQQAVCSWGLALEELSRPVKVKTPPAGCIHLPITQTLVEQVQDGIRCRLHSDNKVPISTLAFGMHMSERTLRRHLAKWGVSYQVLLDRVRFEVAAAELVSARKTADIAWRLGYSEEANFRHAFKRWCGISPGAFKQVLHQGGEP